MDLKPITEKLDCNRTFLPFIIILCEWLTQQPGAAVFGSLHVSGVAFVLPPNQFIKSQSPFKVTVHTCDML